jgi:uncharacterized protein YbjT (DUF2867 family)
MFRNVLILGGTGFVGQALCEALVERSGGAGMRIAVPTRQVARGKNVQFLPTVEVVEANIHDDAQLARLLVGRDAVVNLVAILNGAPSEFERVHVELPRRLAAAMKATGVRRLVHVSALGVGPDAPSNYLRTKTAGEQVLTEAGLDLTVLRPSVIFGSSDRFLSLFALMQSLLPVVPLAGAQARFQPVWVMDVARAISMMRQPSGKPTNVPGRTSTRWRNWSSWPAAAAVMSGRCSRCRMRSAACRRP